MFGIHEDSFTPQLKTFLEKTKPGGFVFFKRNITNLQSFKKLVQDIHEFKLKETQLVPFLAVDEEGGRVSRLPVHPPIPSASVIGKTEDQEISFELGVETGKLLRSVGINMNLAPVIDLGSDKSFLGTRTYSTSPEAVAKFGLSFSKGLYESGVLACAKHFPGIGNSLIDPHLNAGEFTYKEKGDLQKSVHPFSHLTKEIPMSSMMMSHFLYPQIDADNPAVFSPKIYKYIREQIKFDGLLITDDLQMDGIKHASKVPLPENVFKALNAGVDIVMISWSRKSQSTTHEYLLKQYKSGALKKKDVDEKLARIKRFKEWISSYEEPAPRKISSEAPNAKVPTIHPEKIHSEKIAELWKRIRLKSKPAKEQFQ